ncbi:MAG: hypothetical protein HZB38_01390 [Planctomycetes bacterium]|nr:hypothetical protein [Planctomycetota bacterium]
MPIPVSTPDLPFDVVVTGYVPYMRSMELAAADGGTEENPAATYTIAAGQTHLRESLFASQPGQSLSPNLNLEFRWVKSAEEQQALFAPMTGNHELTIEVVDPPVRKVVDVTEGMTIKVDGTAYEIKVAELAPNWPLMTPGFENARSPVARVDVKGPDKQYNRTVVQRYPQLSQDIDEKGTRHREGPYDPNLKLTYRTCAEGWVILAAGPNLTPQIGLFEPDGKPQVASLQVGKPSAINTTGGKLDFTLESLFAKGRALPVPIIEPLESRRPQMGREASAVRITLKGKGAAAGWSESRWIPYSNYPDAEPFAQPIEVNVPGDPATYELVYSRLPRSLDAMLIPGRLSTAFFPGRMSATSWRSEFQVADDSGSVKPAFVETNQTAAIGRYTLFQSGAANDHWSYTILGVGTREAIMPQVLGCILITLGSMYAFYVKPWLRRRAAARNAVATSAAVATQEPAETRELAGVR